MGAVMRYGLSSGRIVVLGMRAYPRKQTSFKAITLSCNVASEDIDIRRIELLLEFSVIFNLQKSS
jgi:hypothetical protein